MTPQEAIQYLERFQEPEPWESQITGEAYEALEMAIDALEKQIPKEPDYVSDGWDPDGVDIWDPHCPNCDHSLESDGEPDHCPNCGQYICWEGE